MEVLAPVKNLYAAKGVIQAGCDAIYLGSPSFSARKSASLDVDEIKEIVEYANARKIKTFVAFNTIIFSKELDLFFKELDQLYVIGISGVILQDIAMAPLIKQHYKDLEVQASTQMNINNVFAANLVNQLGVNRIVAPREMNFKNISLIKKKSNVDVEVFVHGALCVAYSGLCYESSLRDQKSANRGACSQYCRMPSTIINQKSKKQVASGQYPISLKDLNNIDNLNEYQKAGVDSIKIEGRLKDIGYACYLTENYKNKVLDKNYQPEDLSKVFNRSFTSGRINQQNGRELVNQDRINNHGELIGSVKKVILNNDRDYKYYKYKILVEGVVNKLDNLRFVSGDGEHGQVVDVLDSNGYIYSNLDVDKTYVVYKTRDHKLLKHYQNYPSLQNVSVDVDISLVIADEITVTVLDETFVSQAQVQNPLKHVTMTQDIYDKLAKTNDTPYTITYNYVYYNDDSYISFKDLTVLKNEILDSYISQTKVIRDSNLIKPEVTIESNESDELTFYVEVNTIKQYELFKDVPGVIMIIGNLSLLNELKPSASDYILTNSVMYDSEDYKYLEEYDNFMISELGGFKRFKDKNILTNYTLNTTNLINQKQMLELGASATLLSPELNQHELKEFGNFNSIINIYGKITTMLMDYCPINLNKQDGCGDCRLCQVSDYALVDQDGYEQPLRYATNSRISLYSKQPLNLFDELDKLKAMNFSKFHIRLVDEDDQALLAIKDFIVNQEMINLPGNLGNYDKKVL